MGIVLNKLSSGSSLIFDYHNEIIVQLLNGTLQTVNELALLNGANTVLIGDELLQFQNAELIGDNKYRLTKLLRARQGTEWAIDTHNIGDRFILVNSSLLAVNISNNLIGRNILYKAVSIGKSLAETDNIPFTCTAKNLKPFAPVHVNTVKDESDNIIINWVRRSRFDHEWRDNVDVPIGEEAEKYQIDIKQNDQLIRTLEVTTQTAIYTKQQQAIDRIELPANLTATIYQISAQIGRGYGATIGISWYISLSQTHNQQKNKKCHTQQY